MKRIKKIKNRLHITSLSLAMMTLLCVGCTLDYTNPNAADEDELDNKDALIGLGVGIQQVYSVQALDFIVFVPSMTTGEASLILPNVANQKVEEGGASLLGTNLRMIELFSSVARVKSMAELLIANIPKVEYPQAGTKSGLLAWGKFFRALTLGTLAQSWEEVPLTNSINNDAKFVTRTEALTEAVSLLKSALQDIETTPLSDEFMSTVGKSINLKNCINAYLSRYNLVLGAYQDAIDAADNVELSVKSEFIYDNQNQNPMYVGLLRQGGELLFYAPRENFGIDSTLLPEANDERISFYITDDDKISLTGLPVRNGTNAPFFKTATSSIPVYLPGEILLNKAEAYARLDQMDKAIVELNKVRNKTSDDDVFGLGANLPDYSAGTKADLLNEIYKNRRIELFLTGLSLEDSRRFQRNGPASKTSERSRNFYPYPSTERVNNPNTPDDPAL